MNLRDALKFWIPHGLLEGHRARMRARMLAARPPAPPPVPLELASRAPGDLFPGLTGLDVVLPASLVAGGDYMTSPLREMLVLGAICRWSGAARVFEFGTYTGVATLVCAANTPEHAEIFTLDLDPAARETHAHGLGVGGFPEFTPGSAFLGDPRAARIRQLFGDSRKLDLSAHAGRMDLVFIDADHTYEFVRNDTERALAMVRPGGILVWDDYIYTADHPECSGVARCLNELTRRTPCFHLAGTRLAACRVPG